MTQDNYVDANGVTIQDYAAIVTQITDAMKLAYGSNINTNSNSPDGQMIGIFAQAKVDMLEALVQVHSSFSPERATGVSLDQRVAYNGLIRRAATYTRVPITIVTDRVLTLPGLDTSTNPFAVSDLSGNTFLLETTTTTGIGSVVLTFAASVVGAIQTTLNTITKISTITLGVLSVNNPTANTQDGVDEETDVQLRLRRQASVSNQSTGFLNGLIGTLKSVDGVTDAVVFENNTHTTDSNGVPGNSIWAIVDGGQDYFVAEAIYQKRNAGCGMRGSTQVDVIQSYSADYFSYYQTVPIYFDRSIVNKLWIKIVLGSINSTHTPDTTYLAAQILANVTYGINGVADFTAITSLVKSLDPLAVVTVGGVAGPYPYDNAAAYTVGNLVSYGTGNVVYRCKLNSTGNVPTNGTYWDVYTLVTADYLSYLPTATPQGKWLLDASRITVV